MNEDYYVDKYKGGWAVWIHKSAYPWALPVSISGESREKAIERYHRYMGTYERKDFTTSDWT